MDNIKFALISIVVLGLVGAGGYWAFNTIQSGSEYVNNQKIRQLESENADLKEQVATLSSQASAAATAPKPADATPASTPDPKPATAAMPPKKSTTTTTTYKNQSLINELQKLANAGIVLKLKSAGPSVGSVEKFLNVYNKTSNKIDNDYGNTTKAAVAAFQKAQGITNNGEAGKTTFTKMVAWLKKQG